MGSSICEPTSMTFVPSPLMPFCALSLRCQYVSYMRNVVDGLRLSWRATYVARRVLQYTGVEGLR